MTKICKNCGNEFHPTIIINNIKIWMSSRSHCFTCLPYKYHRIELCKSCNREFKPKGQTSKNCPNCVIERRNNPNINMVCKTCGKSFEINMKYENSGSRINCLECIPAKRHNTTQDATKMCLDCHM